MSKKITLWIVAFVVIIAAGFWWHRSMPVPVSTNTSPVSATNVYTDKAYGWSFQYPPTWILTPSADGTSVSIASDIAAPADSGAKAGSPLFSLKFSTVKKTAFKPVGTKFGDISFDATRDTLVDSQEPTPRCLSVTSQVGMNGTLPLIRYGGSSMSTPEYWDAAIVTNSDYMVLADESDYGMGDTDAATADIQAGMNEIYGSFMLAQGVSAAVPTNCSM